MSITIQNNTFEHSPTLNTVLMVEKTLKNMDKSMVTIAQLKKMLPKKVNHNTLKVILTYLEYSNKIAVTLNGITWIHNTNPNLHKAISKGLELWKKYELSYPPEAEEIYNHLNKEAPKSKTENTILKAINKKVELIKVNPHYGNPISKKLIPQDYKDKYEISNLFRVELPDYWRMLYTLTDGESKIEIIAFVLDIIDHELYDKKFGYKEK